MEWRVLIFWLIIFLSDIQDYLKCILKKYEAVTGNASINIYINKIEKKITFKIKTGYYLELLTHETMKLLRSTKSKISKDENEVHVFHLEISEVVLFHWNIVNNNYQHDSRALYTFALNRSFGISPKNSIFLKTFNSEFLYLEVWFTNQNSKPLEIEDKINISLVIN